MIYAQDHWCECEILRTFFKQVEHCCAKTLPASSSTQSKFDIFVCLCVWLQILENAEINNLIKIVGLQYNKKYTSEEDLKSLRYGHIMIMTDQDQDGSHIKGLLINFIHSNWPDLTRLPFLEEFITPIVKVSDLG